MGRKRALVTQRDVERWISQGFGNGEGQAYKPWLRVSDVPSKGRSKRIFGLKSGRVHHLLSDLEYAIFLVSEYSQLIVEIREQFPLLPYGITETIAADLGIIHPVYPESDTAIVVTTDFLLTPRPDMKDQRLIAVSGKYRSKTKGRAKRTLEKLEIERRFCVEHEGYRWSCVTDADLNPQVIENLDWLHYGVDHQPTASLLKAANQIAPMLQEAAYNKRSLAAALKSIRAHQSFPNVEPLLAFKLAAWRGLLPLDLSVKIGLRHPVVELPLTGGQAIAA